MHTMYIEILSFWSINAVTVCGLTSFLEWRWLAWERRKEGKLLLMEWWNERDRQLQYQSIQWWHDDAIVWLYHHRYRTGERGRGTKREREKEERKEREREVSYWMTILILGSNLLSICTKLGANKTKWNYYYYCTNLLNITK